MTSAAGGWLTAGAPSTPSRGTPSCHLPLVSNHLGASGFQLASRHTWYLPLCCHSPWQTLASHTQHRGLPVCTDRHNSTWNHFSITSFLTQQQPPCVQHAAVCSYRLFPVWTLESADLASSSFAVGWMCGCGKGASLSLSLLVRKMGLFLKPLPSLL